MPNLERIPPHDTNAEESVLGAALLDSNAFYEISSILTDEDFYVKANGEIFKAMHELALAGDAIDLITVSDCLNKRKSLDAVGGRANIARLTGMVPSAANAKEYAKIVREKSVLRQLISASSTISEQAFSQEIEPSSVLEHAESAIFNIAATKDSGSYYDIKEVLAENLADIHAAEANGGEIQGLKTGFKDLDHITTGFQKSDLIIIAARPSMGKTAFALNIAEHAAVREGKRVVIFSVEMNERQLGMRLLAMEARVESDKLRRGTLNADDWEDINNAVEKMSKADLIIDATPGIGVMELRNKCRRIHMQKPIDMIVIDYMQIMGSEGKSESRQLEVSYISRYLKQLAREMNCPVVVLSQLSRAVESNQRSSKRPVLSDLRDSGSIEQDADIVMFLYREDYYKKDPNAENTNTCEVIVAKQRNGATGSVFLTWIPKYTRFADKLREPENQA